MRSKRSTTIYLVHDGGLSSLAVVRDFDGPEAVGARVRIAEGLHSEFDEIGEHAADLQLCKCITYLSVERHDLRSIEG